MRYFASDSFWSVYERLPAEIRAVADKNYQLLETNPRHRSLHLKKVGRYWSVRVGEGYRALGVGIEGGILWIWIGTHAEYNRRISS